MNKRLIRKLNKPFKRYHNRSYWTRVVEERIRNEKENAKKWLEEKELNLKNI